MDGHRKLENDGLILAAPVTGVPEGMSRSPAIIGSSSRKVTSPPSVKVSAVQHGGAVVPVDLSVYDTNGNEGIPVPGSEELLSLIHI